MKHIKIEYDSGAKKYFLYIERHFDTVVELINFYRHNNLSDGFALDAILKGTPLKGNLYRAVSAYSRPDASSKYLTLNPGDIVRVLETAGDLNGWWKGTIGAEGKVGFFPVSYVERIPELQQNEESTKTTLAEENEGGGGIVAYQSTQNGENEPIQLAIAIHGEENGVGRNLLSTL